ncbi:MAG TPA: acetylornithine transaminase [Firmicutes bacterium]|jgi:acetylornithine/N-succinyldiaminopimelate aminotransferase|nr:acetylornithine transaminase [Bacillota bacterium]
MDTKEIIELGTEFLTPNYGRMPLALVKGQGTRVWDADGKVYLDFVSGIAVNSLGHCHPKVVAAIQEAATQMLHCSNLYYNQPQIELARFLAQKSSLNKAFFCNSGAEANEAAIKLARRYARLFVSSERYEIITAEHSFHGRTMGALAATGQTKYQQYFDPLVPGFRYVPLNDVSALAAAIGPHTAAVLLEPIQGEGGVNPMTQEYAQAARELCTKEGIALIFDEVQTGIGRTGKWFGFEHLGVVPDIISLAKALGGGLPIGCIMASDRFAQAFTPGTHASTFGGGPFITRVALAALRAIEEEGLVDKAAVAGAYLTQGLTELAKRYPTAVGAVRGAGCLLGVPLNISGGKVAAAALERGLLVNVIGDKVLRLLPPLNVSKAEMDEALQILDAAISEALT